MPGNRLFRPSLFAAICLGLAALAAGGCRRTYDQSSPDAVLKTAKLMVEKGDADLLPNLLYADSKEMRALLDQLGVVMGSLQELGTAVQKAFPAEIEKLKRDAADSAAKGDASGFLARIAGQASQQMSLTRRGQRPQLNINDADDPNSVRNIFDNAMKELFADPYGWIAANESRLSTVQMTDDQAAILWDGKPIFGIGLSMTKSQDDKWYVVLPLNAPGIGNFMPKTAESWEIMGSLMAVLDNMLQDLTSDVRRGRARQLDELAKLAGEKAFIPAVMVFFAYSKSIEAEKKAAKEAKAVTTPAPAATTPTPPK